MITAYEVNERLSEEDYRKVVKEFGAKFITKKLASKIGHRLVPLLFFVHRDLDTIIEDDFAIVSGRGPSMRMHLAHLLVFRFVRFLQKKLPILLVLVVELLRILLRKQA